MSLQDRKTTVNFFKVNIS